MHDPATILELIKEHNIVLIPLDDGRWSEAFEDDFCIECIWYERDVRGNFVIADTLEDAVMGLFEE